ncbi:tetraacyldisaccharide 4'-kinase [Pedobacter sp. MW01-1-1]|uniref:tetraacyldisaccharide 4'-kinase n=1 Tax=Pedobacter sp. MW01-1-1 TaxID=3383027 RepID=UPI003FEE1B70
MLKKIRLLLLPFSLIYGAVILLRNKLYDWGILVSQKFDLPVICVGNLAVGGSGKTPTTEYLVQLLADTYKVAILSRGYGRKTKGFILADAAATAESIGDEPLQYYRKFMQQVSVAVCEDRRTGIQQLATTHDLIILDDAFQHRKVQAGFNILLFEFEKLRKMQFLLPAGNLRDVFSSRRRADVSLVTKSPISVSLSEQQESIAHLRPTKNQHVFHTYINYSDLKHVYTEEKQGLNFLQNKTIFLLTGIANSAPLLHELSKHTKSIKHQEHPDHYSFKRADILRLKEDFVAYGDAEKIILTTEKDSQRLRTTEFADLLLDLPVFYLPIEVTFFAQDKGTFDELILNYVKSNRRNR